MQKQKKPFSLMAFIKPHRAGFITATVLAVLSVASGMVPYFAVAKMVNLLISGEKSFSVYLTWGAVALIAYLLKSIFHGISTRCSHEATFHVLSELRRAVADKLTRVSMGYLTDTPSGRLKTTMVERVEQMEVPLAHIIPEMTSNLLVPIAIVAYLFALDWRMALVSLITIPIGMLCYMAQMKEYPKKYGAVVQAGKHMSATTVEYINGIEVIKAFNQSAASYGKFTQAVRQSADLMLDWMKSTQGYSALMMTIWPAVLIGVLPIGCVFYRNGSLTAPDFITISILSLGIVGPLVAAIFLTDDFSKIATITGEIGAVLSEPDLKRPAQRKELHGLDIDLRDVTFAYKDKQVLNSVTLNIRQGTTTALVGPSGSGKSTIAKLIASYWDAGGGSITIGGERQRLSIARAMLKDAPIIILDEATANVDPENEAELQEAVKALTAGKTLVMIAHRMKTVQEADQILVLDQGRIVQRGRHAELMQQGGIYADFVCSRKSAESWRIAEWKSNEVKAEV